MRILSLRFKNLNSLKGEFLIDFTDPALARSGLFAITGPTGAGKSTILDAITLSLYSYIPRYGYVTRTTVSDQNAVVTRRTSQAFSELTFAVGGKTFRTNWSIHMANNGNWQPVSYSISEKNDVGDFIILAGTILGTRELVPKIVGLNSEQFTQSIVLSQGRFDEFLKANKDDRYALLEVITGSGIFRQIGKKAYEKEGDVKKNMELLRSELAGLQTLPEDSLAEKRMEKESLEKNARDLRLAIEKWSKMFANRENVVKKRSELRDRQEEQERLDADWKTFAEEHNRLSVHEKAIGFLDQWNQLQMLISRFTEKKKEIGAYEKTIGKSESDCRSLINELGTSAGVSVDEESFIDVLTRFTQKVKDLDVEIQSLRSQIETERGNAKTNLSVMPDEVKADLRSIASDSAKLDHYIRRKEEELTAAPLPAWVGVGKIDEAIDLLRKDMETVKESLIVVESISETSNRIDELTNSIEEAETKGQLLRTQLEEIQHSLEKSDQLVKFLEEAIEKNRAFNALESYRNELVNGEPCPCCGSIEHPYAVGTPAQEADNHENLRKAKVAHKTNLLAINERNAGLSGLEQQMNNDRKRIETERTRLVESKGKLDRYRTQLVSIYKDGFSDIPKCLLDIREALDVVSRHRDWQKLKAPMKMYAESLSKGSVLSQTLDERKTARSDLFGAKDVDEFRDRMNKGWTSATTLLNDNRDRLEAARSDWRLIEKEKDTLTVTFMGRILASGFTDLDDFKNSLLDDNAYQRISRRSKQLQSEKDALTARIDTIAKELEKAESLDDPSLTDSYIEERLNEARASLESNREKTGSVQKELDTDARNRLRHDELMHKYNSAESLQKLYATLNSYIGDRDGDKFNRAVQRLTLQHLFRMANRRMMQLMDRYRIELADGTDDIWLTDLYMGDEKRVISSASGGERFVISLALALSLSEMASMNVKIDSMFIDEGFGSLSPDELYQAIDMLERLQVENEKMVGIISHVESLKERITTQIVAQKLQEGESTLVLKVLDNERSLRIAG